MKKVIRLSESDLVRLVRKVLNEQSNTNPQGGTNTNFTGQNQNQNKDNIINKMGLKPINDAFIKYGFTRNDNPENTRSLYQLIATYDKKPFYLGDISEDGKAGVRVLTKTTIKDIAIQKCDAKTHTIDPNYIILDKNNADCVLGRLTMQITD